MLPRVLTLVMSALCLGAHPQILLTGAGAPLHSSGGGGTLTLNGTQTCALTSSGANCAITAIPVGHSVVVHLIQESNATDTYSAVKLGAADTMTEVSASAPVSWVGCAGATTDAFVLAVTTGSDATLTATTSGGHGWFAMIWDLTSGSGSIAIDQHNSPGASGTNPLGPSITTTAASELITTTELFSSSGTAVAAPFTFQAISGGEGAAYNVTAATGTFQPHWTGGNTTCGTIVSVRP